MIDIIHLAAKGNSGHNRIDSIADLHTNIITTVSELDSYVNKSINSLFIIDFWAITDIHAMKKIIYRSSYQRQNNTFICNAEISKPVKEIKEKIREIISIHFESVIFSFDDRYKIIEVIEDMKSKIRQHRKPTIVIKTIPVLEIIADGKNITPRVPQIRRLIEAIISARGQKITKAELVDMVWDGEQINQGLYRNYKCRINKFLSDNNIDIIKFDKEKFVKLDLSNIAYFDIKEFFEGNQKVQQKYINCGHRCLDEDGIYFDELTASMDDFLYTHPLSNIQNSQLPTATRGGSMLAHFR